MVHTLGWSCFESFVIFDVLNCKDNVSINICLESKVPLNIQRLIQNFMPPRSQRHRILLNDLSRDIRKVGDPPMWFYTFVTPISLLRWVFSFCSVHGLKPISYILCLSEDRFLCLFVLIFFLFTFISYWSYLKFLFFHFALFYTVWVSGRPSKVWVLR